MEDPIFKQLWSTTAVLVTNSSTLRWYIAIGFIWWCIISHQVNSLPSKTAYIVNWTDQQTMIKFHFLKTMSVDSIFCLYQQLSNSQYLQISFGFTVSTAMFCIFQRRDQCDELLSDLDNIIKHSDTKQSHKSHRKSPHNRPGSARSARGTTPESRGHTTSGVSLYISSLLSNLKRLKEYAKINEVC